jgi:hypothetical protein
MLGVSVIDGVSVAVVETVSVSLRNAVYRSPAATADAFVDAGNVRGTPLM